MNPEINAATQRACKPTPDEDQYHDLFDPTKPSESRDALFATDVTESALYYLGPYLKNHPNLLLPETEAQKAFTYGYVCALHKSHTLNAALFIHGQELLTYVKGSVREALQDPRPAYLLVTAELTERIGRYLFDANENRNLTGDDISDAFIAGYQTAFICNDKYDRCLFMYGHALHVEVLAGIISYREKEENARRAAARIIVNKYGSGNKNRLRAQGFENQRLNDNGQLVDEFGHPIPSEQL